MKAEFGAFLARHRRKGWARSLDKFLIKLHKAYENLDYDIQRNGEAHLLQRLKEVQAPKVVFDVGANRGTWSVFAVGLFPQANIHAFEIVPETFTKLEESCAALQNVQTWNLGLSDEAGATTVYFTPGMDGHATCVEDFTERFHKYQPQKIEARVTTGDAFCAEHSIDSVDFLKIDVEGFEHKVLQGFEGMLKQGCVKIIQFEYGYVNIDTHFLLKDFYDKLGAYDMKIGKIYPSYVDFREYKYSDENFYGPNYLAVHSSCAEILRALSE